MTPLQKLAADPDWKAYVDSRDNLKAIEERLLTSSREYQTAKKQADLAWARWQMKNSADE